MQYWWWSGLGSESRIGPVGSFTLAAAPRKGPAGQGLAFQARFDEPAATGFALHSFSRLWVKDTRVNSPATVDAAEQELPEAPNMFGKPVDRLSDDLATCIHLPSFRRLQLGPHGGAQRCPDLYLLTYPGLVVSLPTRGYVGIELSFGEHTQIAFAAISRICRE